MSLIKVEIIVAAGDHGANPEATRKGNILAIQPAGTKWGVGSLTGNVMFVCELDLPYGNNCMVKRRCVSCEHRGIEWDVEPPIKGTKGSPKQTCPLQKHMAADVEYTLDFIPNGHPIVRMDSAHKHGSKIDFSKISTISDDTVDAIKNEWIITGLISSVEKDVRVLRGRKALNRITSDKLELR